MSLIHTKAVLQFSSPPGKVEHDRNDFKSSFNLIVSRPVRLLSVLGALLVSLGKTNLQGQGQDQGQGQGQGQNL